MSADRNRPGRRRPTARVRLVAEPLEPRQLLAIITVTSAGDADGADGGPTLSLRQAIEVSNGTLAIAALSKAQAGLVAGALGTPNTIDFAIPGTGPFTIRPAASLPAITSPVVIDGYSQPGARPNTNGPGLGKTTVIEIALDGSKAPGTTGLDLQAGDSTVEGLAVGGFTANPSTAPDSGVGIVLEGQAGDLIRGDFIGTDATGTHADPNAEGIEDTRRYLVADGVVNLPRGFDTIGGSAPGDGNVISGNSDVGLFLKGGGPLGYVEAPVTDLVQGNFIGTDLTGRRPLANANNGLQDAGGGTSTIGGTAAGAGNVLSGNLNVGLEIVGYQALTVGGGFVAPSNDLVQGNFIGTDPTGSAALPNGGDGAVVAGGSSTIGGTAEGAGNVLSGNGSSGLGVDDTPGGLGLGGVGATVTIQGNHVGTDLAGTVPLPNAFDGILAADSTGRSKIGGTAAGAANVIAFNQGSGVAINTDNVINFPPVWTISGNSIFANGDLGITYSTELARLASSPPVIRSVEPSGPGSLILGTLSGYGSSTYTVEFFADDAPDPSGSGQGRTYLGSTEVTTPPGDDQSPDTFSGFFSFFSDSPLLGRSITATATLGQTSSSIASQGFGASTTEFARDVLAYSTPTTTTLLLSGFPPFGEPYDLNAIVHGTAGTPTGQVAFLVNGQVLGTSTLDDLGHATLSIPISPGAYTFEADYLGDGADLPSKDGPIVVALGSVASTTLLAGPTTPTPVGRPVTLIAAVPEGRLGVATGSVEFDADGVALGTAPLGPDGVATLTTTALALAPGTYTIQADYLGDLHNDPSQSAPFALTIAAPATSPTNPTQPTNPTTTTLAGPPALVTAGQPATFTATVQGLGGAASGVVAFAEGGVLLDLAPVNASGVATFTTSALAPGLHAIQAAYLGDPDHPASVSGGVVGGVAATIADDGPTVLAIASPTLDSITIAFRGALKVADAQDPANYTIIGPDGKAVAIESVEYDPRDDSVTIETRKPFRAESRYKVTVNGRRAGRIVGLDGLPLDGGHGGPAGSNFTATIATGHAPKHPSRPKKAAVVHKNKG